MSDYYDGTKLLSLADLDGNKPEIYMCTSNRTGGKTTYFSRLLVNRFKKRSEKFGLLYRFDYELDDISDKFFKDVQLLFFPGDDLTSKRRAKGVYHELFLNDEPCGYAFAINKADQIKKCSHLFSDTSYMFMDEFQSETNKYCPDEIRKFISIHTSIARGRGQQVRYVPVYMCANPVSMLNPYYTELGVSERLDEKTRFLRGHGWVLEQGYVKSAADAQGQSAFNRAFEKNSYVAYSSESVYLNDSSAFIEKPEGTGRYICTVKESGVQYGIREYEDSGVVYCDDRADSTFPVKFAIGVSDHDVNYVLMRRNDYIVQTLRWYFETGSFRFKDVRCKAAVLKLLSYGS